MPLNHMNQNHCQRRYSALNYLKYIAHILVNSEKVLPMI
jgi:hypothetical protein